MVYQHSISIVDKKDSIEIGHSSLLERLTIYLQTSRYDKIVLITDKTVASVCSTNGTSYYEELKQHLQDTLPDQATRFRSLIIDTKPIKSRANRDAIEDTLLQFQCGQDTLLVALGGGGVLEMVGIVAACFRRGISWLAIPTTLLSMVGSGVGGQTGLDVPGYGRNVIGAVWHPEKILVDLRFLDTLPEHLWMEGWSEMLKLSIISNKGMFEDLEGLSSKACWSIMWRQAPDQIERWIHWSIHQRATIISSDSNEGHGFLDFGQTIGRALELHLHMTRGQAAALGMYYQAQLSYLLDYLNESQAERVKTLISDFGWPPLELDHVSALVPYLRHDQNSKLGGFKMVLLKSIGVPVFAFVDEQTICTALAHSYKLAKFRLVLPHKRAMRVPGSKSITNRAILLAALHLNDPTESITLLRVLVSEDTTLMIQALKTLNLAVFEWTDEGHLRVRRPPPLAEERRGQEGVAGVSGNSQCEKHVYVGNAGTVIRFLIPVCCLSPRLKWVRKIVVESCVRMAERPFAQIFESMNAKQAGTLVWVHGTARSVQNDRVAILEITPFAPSLLEASDDASFEISPYGSSQFISGLLMALASLESPSVFLVKHVQRLEDIPSYPFVQMTLDVLQRMQVATVRVSVESETSLKFSIHPTAAPGWQDEPCTRSLAIEPDLTAASYPLAFAMMTEAELILSNMSAHSCQGDKAFIDILARLGASVEYANSSLYFRGSLQRRSDEDMAFDLTQIGDTFMTLAVLAPILIEFGCAASVRLTGLSSQNSKECERVRITMEHLVKCGVAVSVSSDYDELWIGSPASWEGLVRIDPNNDHRIAMSFSLLGAYVAQSATRCDRMSLVIDNIETTRKTWPQYWHQMSEAFGWSYQPA